MTAAVLAFLFAAAPAEAVVRVRATAALEPCARAALAAVPAGVPAGRVEKGAPLDAADADVLVASAVELTRALESGRAEPGTDVDLARVPWVLSGPKGGALAAGDAVALGRAADEIWLPEGPSSYEARRWVESLAPGRARLVGAEELSGAELALVPLPLALGPRLAADVPPLVARAALVEGSRRGRAARRLLDWLGSEAGRRAFSACGQEAAP